MNIFDYLDWRSDIPFSADPFNEVDSLVLCELAYAPMEDIFPDGNDKISIEEAAKRFFAVHTVEEIRSAEGYTASAPLLLLKMAGSRRFGGTKVFGYENYYSEEKTEQMAAVGFILPDHSCYAAYRGTDNTIAGWKEDFELSYKTGTAGQERAAAWLMKYCGHMRRTIRVGGHSKGGNFAVYAAMKAAPSLQKRIRAVYSNDGPGFRHEVIDSEAYQNLLGKIISVVPESSMIGMCMENRYQHIIVESTNKDMEQHDALSWQVMRNHFVEKEKRSQESIFFDSTIRTWIQDIPDEERKRFVDSLFSFYEATGKQTMNEIHHIDPITSVRNILNNLRSMPKEDQKQFFAILMKLVKSANIVISNDAENSLKEIIEKRRENKKKPDQELS